MTPTPAGVNSKAVAPHTGLCKVSASNAAPTKIFSLPNQRRVVMSATTLTMTKNNTPLFGAP